MKRLCVLLLGLLSAAPVSAAETYVLDPTHTYPGFFVSHAGLSIMQGRFDQTEGTVVLDREGGSSLRAVVKTASIDTGHEGRDKILRGKQFLESETFPDMVYQSSQVTFTGKDTARIDGELSLHGVSKPLSLQLTRIACGVHPLKRTWSCGFSAVGKLRRSDFGMDSFLSSVGDEIELRIEAEGERQEKKAGPRG